MSGSTAKAMPCATPNGKLIGIEGILSDVTERKNSPNAN